MMMERGTRLLSTGQVAHLCGVSADTVRHYEHLGVIPPAARGANGYRGYPEAVVDRVRVVRRAVALGFTLAELARLLRQRDAGRAPCRDVQSLAASKLADLDQRLAEMHALRDTLAEIVASWDAKLAAVPDGRPAYLLDSLIERTVERTNE
jgi:DNA-binding transcriptional MerR regulator